MTWTEVWIPWLLLGGMVGGLNGLTLCWTVSRLRPGALPYTLAAILGGTLLRWGTVAVALALALRQGIGPGLLVFAGLWLARWGMVMLVGVRPDAVYSDQPSPS